MKKIPVHLICGPLGIGKTSAIIAYLRRQAGKQFVAVLVNDFGPVGLDAAIMEGDLGSLAREQTTIHMLPGGCICCSAATGLMDAMEKLAGMPQVDRIIIEPSGLAMVGDMVDLVQSVAERYHLELRPIITLVEPRLMDRLGFLKAPYYVRMVEAADILVANRMDLASEDQTRRFEQWAGELYPPKTRILKTTQGDIPDEIFEVRHGQMPQRRQGKNGRGEKHTEGHFPGGCLFPAQVLFDAQGVMELLQKLHQEGFVGNKVMRLKAILQTQEGWRLYEIAGEQIFTRPTDYRRDNRVDWIMDGVPVLDEAVQELFQGTMVKAG